MTENNNPGLTLTLYSGRGNKQKTGLKHSDKKLLTISFFPEGEEPSDPEGHYGNYSAGNSSCQLHLSGNETFFSIRNLTDLGELLLTVNELLFKFDY